MNPAYLRSGFTLGFGLGSILLYKYAWHGLIAGEYFRNFLVIASCIVAGLIGATICLKISHSLVPEYSPYSNLDSLTLDLWHCIAYSVIFWFLASVIHLMISFEPAIVITNPVFPKERIGLLIVSIGIIMGIGFSFTKLIGGALKSEILSLLGPVLVGVVMGGIQGYLLGSDIISIPESVILRAETMRIIVGAILGLIVTPISILTAIHAKRRDLHELFQLLQKHRGWIP